MSNLVRGSLLLTVATFLSKFLGLIYLIPFNMLVGPEGATLYNIAYVPYNIMLSISTIGIPLAMSKTISKYNALGDYATGRRTFKSGTVLMFITGFISFLILYFGAELLANWIITSEGSQGASVNDVVLVIRAVSFALIIIPAMSIMRGFFQGHESMGPSAISTVTEQIVRIIFVLVSVFIVMVILKGTVAIAVGFATFGAFVGAVGSWFILLWYWKKRKPHLDKLLTGQVVDSELTTKDIFKEMFSYAGPFIIVGLATSLYQLVDLFTFDRALVAAGNEEMYWTLGAINTLAHKIVIIPGTIATGLSLAILPALTRTFAQRNIKELHTQINQSLQIVLVLVIPAVIGIACLADVFYASLYGMEEIATTGPLLAWYAPVGLFFALFTVTASILQGINQQNFTVLSLMAGLLVKILLNIQLIQWFGAKGLIFGTGLAVIIAVCINLFRIKRSVEFPFRQVLKRTMLILIFGTIMALFIFAVKAVFGIFISYETSRTGSIIVLLAGVAVGGGVYLWLAYASTLLHHVFGDEIPIVDKLLRKLRK
ncbi:putative polysaccharide biosynthesis protein [Oceanobacillus alkalisoli]|uniref:putative polysaccharide biosynthesis protein n=1 Tax=Oceanobacillus alkalisoli TaxID=2925113 RepID=UPI001EE4D079|nr:polysaccharide biosynthesis protein [Oceanobacillus alkalisoli]MCG5105233.1 polysaccharide biosynthesis protein [Oceanobacillus alkalisoli]